MSISKAKCAFFLSLCASRITSSLLLTFPKSQAGIVSSVFPFLVHGSLCIQNLHRLWHWDELVHQIIMCHQSKSFTCNTILMSFGLQRFCSLSRRFVGFHCATIHCLELAFIASLRHCLRFHDARMLLVPLAGHGGCHRSFHFLSSVFLRISECSLSSGSIKVNSPHLSSTVKPWFFFRPFLFFHDSEQLYHFSSKRLDIHDLVLWSSESLSISPRTTCILLEVSFFSRVNFVNPLQDSDRCLLDSTFQ